MSAGRRSATALAAFCLGLGFAAVSAAEVTKSLAPLGITGPYTLRYPQGHLSDPIPFQLVRGVHPVVDVTINGTDHLRLLVDSGATTLTLPPSLGSPFVRSLCFGNGACFDNIVAVLRQSPYTRDTPGAINGLIGFNLLATMPVTLDYAKRQLVFGRAAPDDAIRVPIAIPAKDQRPFGAATIGGRKIDRILFDTGASYVRLKPDVIGRLGDAAVPAGSEVAFSISDEEKTRLFAVSLMCVGAKVCVDGETAQRGSWQAIGASFWRHFRVTIDAQAGVFALAPYAAPPIFINARERWGFQIALDDAARIVQVDAGSVAAAAGISTSDTLLAVNGQDIAALGYLGAHAVLEADDRTEVTLDLRRGSKLRTVVLTVN